MSDPNSEFGPLVGARDLVPEPGLRVRISTSVWCDRPSFQLDSCIFKRGDMVHLRSGSGSPPVLLGEGMLYELLEPPEIPVGSETSPGILGRLGVPLHEPLLVDVEEPSEGGLVDSVVENQDLQPGWARFGGGSGRGEENAGHGRGGWLKHI